MTESNLIQWPSAKFWDIAWNPIIGCRPCSPACEHCYAAAWAKRFGQSFEPHTSSQTRPPTKGVVFCGNMTDLFGEWVIDAKRYICHTTRPGKNGDAYLYLTKRVQYLCDCLRAFDRVTHLNVSAFSNHYFGFTAENQEWYDKRIRDYRGLKPDWANGWLSAEPLLGPIDLGLGYIAPEDQPFKWVVVGCESGPNRRPCKLEWVEDIVDQCRAAGVPVFVKQLDIDGKCETDINKFPAHLRIRQVPWAKEAAND